MDSIQIRRQQKEGHYLSHLTHGGVDEAFLTLTALPNETPADLLQRLYAWLSDYPRWRILRQDVFGIVHGESTAAEDKSYRLSGSDWPETWVEEGTGQGNPVSGLQLQAVGGISTRPVRVGDRTLGVVYEDPWARYCVLGGLLPSDTSTSREHQTQQVFDLMELGLAEAGMSFLNVFRTWFYLDEILDWYDGFNGVRNAFFNKHGVYDRLVPASTGIGGRNAQGGALVADLIALEAKSSEFSLRPLPSPLQCPALEYGSSFSRAVELAMPGQRRVLVSGTASIAPEGHTIHVGDINAQIKTTMDVVEAILKLRGLGWEDTVRAIGYFKHAGDIPAFERYRAAEGLSSLPIVIAKNDVCRDDLLFELELDAVSSAAG